MRFIFCFISLFLITIGLWAQTHTSQPNGFFTIDEIKGCAPLTVTINSTVCSGIGCDVNYEFNIDPSAAAFKSYQLEPTHTYTAPGVYTIFFIRGGGNNNVDQIQVEVVDNIKPKIEVNNCGGANVSLSILDNNYDQYVVNYNDGSADIILPPATDNQHAYGAAGDFVVSVRGLNNGAADNCNVTNETVKVIQGPLTAPKFTQLNVLDNNSIRLAFNGIQNVKYNLEIRVNNGASFQQIKSLYNTTVDTVKDIVKPDDNFYNFRVSAYNPCSGVSLYSGIIYSANFDLSVVDDQNISSWVTSTVGTSDVSIQINSPSSGSSFTTAAPGSQYIDEDITCGTEYCYQLIMTYPDGEQSFSLEKCGTAISHKTPARISNIASVVNDPGVSLEWEPNAAFTPKEFSIYKSTGSNYTLLTKTSSLALTDETYTTTSGSCYKMTYIDVCNNESKFSTEACPIQLTGSLSADNTITLNWSEYKGNVDGIDHYTVEKYTPGGTFLASVDVTGLTYTDNVIDPADQIYVYVVKGIPNVAGLPFSISNKVEIIKNPNLVFPKAFTPNGDNLNDNFKVFGVFVTSFELNIFNRWGELMFTTTAFELGWDGNYKGNPMPEGTYTFIATINDIAGRTFKKSGSVVLLRRK
jgi:gliding motility-associated-like protein